MPSRLAKTQKKVTVNANGKSSIPKNDAEWTNFIQSFIRFLLKRYGREEIESWHFEVWNEPNMSTFFSGTQKDYFHLYETTARAIKAVDNNIQVGGPATAAGAWIEDFIAFVESNHIPCDFISTHNYPGDGIGDVFLGKIMFNAIVGGTKRLVQKKHGSTLDGCRAVMEDKSEQSEMPKGQMREIGRRLQEIIRERYPLYMTEWNCNAILMSATNDDKKVAAFDVKTIDETDDYVTGSSIWCFSDIFDEFMMIPDEFSGGFGLLTINGIPKPQFHALKLMAGTGERKYCLPYTNDEVEVAVYESDTEKRIFVYRQRMKNVKEPPVDYSIDLEISQTAEQVSLYRIDENHCNPKKIWQEIGSPVTPNAAEIAEIKNRSALTAEPVFCDIKNNILSLSGTLNVNDVHCYVIKTV
jgi:xylan 1,4-beta-xylosidase